MKHWLGLASLWPCMRVIRATLAVAFGVILLGWTPAMAAKMIVIGDSIGVGVSMASGLPRFAHNSVGIRSADALSQLKRVPKNSIALLSLGTNDAVGSIGGVEKSIDKIVAAAAAADVQLVWIGPPCVMKSWNKNVAKLDEILRMRLAGRIAYVSVAGQEICDGSLRSSDGVHFNLKGYSLLWARAREIAGLPTASSSSSNANENAPAPELQTEAQLGREAAHANGSMPDEASASGAK